MQTTYDWLPERVTRMERIARELSLELTWSTNSPASEQSLSACAKALQRVNIPFSATHREFLTHHNGAELVYTHVDADDPEPYGATFTIFSTDQIIDAVEECYFSTEHTRFMPRYFWDPTIPVIDLDDGDYLVSDPRIITNGEPAILWSEDETGPVYGDGISYVAHSFETCLIQMFDRIGLKRATPKSWRDSYQKLRFDWRAPDNRHRTNFPLDGSGS
jgi:hypothetical protein